MASQIALGATISLMIVGVLVWLDSERRRGYAPPRHWVPSAVYRLMERARARLFKGSDSVRLTVFMPHSERSDTILPIARIGWGRPSAESKAEFRSGQGLAGLAVETRAMVVAWMGPFEDLEQARLAHKEAFGLTDEQIKALSEKQLRAQVMIAAPLWQGELLRGVLCVDSLDSTVIPVDADPSFWNALNRLAADLAEALPASLAPVNPARLPPDVEGASVYRIDLQSAVRPAQQTIGVPTASGRHQRLAVG